MRWLFADPNDHQENSDREKIVAQIDAWWAAFEEAVPEIIGVFTQKSQFDLPDFMHRNLQAMSRNLMWEFGRGTSGSGYRLVITCEFVYFLRPLVDEILKRAPKLDGWEFLGARPAESIEDALAMVEARNGKRSSCKGVDCEAGEDGRVHLAFTFPALGFQEREALREAFVLTEILVGEEMLDTWIGEVKAKGAVFGGGKLALSELRSAVNVEIRKLTGKMLPEPRWKIGGGKLPGVLFDLRRRTKEQHEDASRDDLMSLNIDEQIGTAVLQGLPFRSLRYSRFGEIFCFIQIDNSGQELPHTIDTRSSIEDALDNALTNAKLGCVIGAGFGTAHLSIELALMDVYASLPIIREVLQSFSVPKKSWLLFHDSIWKSEWCGIWPDTPTPSGLQSGDQEESINTYGA